MRKVLIIAFGLMASCLSAMDLPDHIKVVENEKITLQAPQSLFVDEILLVDNSVLSDFKSDEISKQLPTFYYVATANLIDLSLFYQPIHYEKIPPSVTYDIKNTKAVFRNELYEDNQFRIQNIPRELI